MWYQWERFHYSKNDWLESTLLTGKSQWYNTASTFKALSIKKKLYLSIKIVILKMWINSREIYWHLRALWYKQIQQWDCQVTLGCGNPTSIFSDTKESHMWYREGHLVPTEEANTMELGPIGQVKSKHWVTSGSHRGDRDMVSALREFKVSPTVGCTQNGQNDVIGVLRAVQRNMRWKGERVFSAGLLSFLPPSLTACLPQLLPIWCEVNRAWNPPGWVQTSSATDCATLYKWMSLRQFPQVSGGGASS